ncbi:MAG: HAD family phosphatase [Clostridia bacterium]|nr:HAD family phosphatase [Clostridia bacterium]
MTIQPVRMISLDMDGTLLLNDHATIHPENIRAIRAAQHEGIEVMISTGRLPEDISDFLHRAELKCGMICCNGTTAFSGPQPGGKRLVYRTFDAETANRIIDIMLPYHIMINAFETGLVSTDAAKPDHRYHLLSRGLIKEHRGETALRQSAARGIMKFYCMEAPERADQLSMTMESIRQKITSICPKVQVTRSAPGIVEIMPADVGKGLTLLQIAASKGIGPEAVMAVGDEENDLDMLSRVAYSVAMGNASERVLETCRYITEDNDHAGVAEAIYFAMGRPSKCHLK